MDNILTDLKVKGQTTKFLPIQNLNSCTGIYICNLLTDTESKLQVIMNFY